MSEQKKISFSAEKYTKQTIKSWQKSFQKLLKSYSISMKNKIYSKLSIHKKYICQAFMFIIIYMNSQGNHWFFNQTQTFSQPLFYVGYLNQYGPSDFPIYMHQDPYAYYLPKEKQIQFSQQNFQRPNIKVEEPPDADRFEFKQQSQRDDKICLTKQQLLQRRQKVQKNAWSGQEDEKLINLVEKQKCCWKQIAQRMGNRTYKMCYSRYRRMKNIGKISWTKRQQQLISQFIQKHGKKWKIISQKLVNRTPKQIRERYINFIRPNIKQQDWTVQQDLFLIEQINIHGRQWRRIEEIFGNRTQNQLKNRYFSRILKLWKEKKKRGLKTEEQTDMKKKILA